MAIKNIKNSIKSILIFITEMKDYYLRKKFEPETKVQKLFKLVKKVEKF